MRFLRDGEKYTEIQYSSVAHL